jgi:transposase
MDAHKVRAEVSRLEVVEVGRRRRWSLAEKLRIVEESLAAPRQVSATARRHGISRSLLMQWRKAYLAGGRHPEAPGFLPVTVAPSPLPAGVPSTTASTSTGSGRMEIVLANGRRIVVGTDVDGEALARVVAALERG